MIKIGNKEQIFTGSFMAKDHEEALVHVPIERDTLRISFKFLPGEESERDATWVTEGGIVKFTIKGWRNSLGTCIAEPAKFGDIGNRKLYVQIAQYLIGSDNNLCHMFIFLGAPNE